MNAQQLKIVFKRHTLRTSAALAEIREILKDHGMPLTGFDIDDQPIDFTLIPSDIAESKPHGFYLEGNGLEGFSGSVAGSDLDFLLIKSADEQLTSWDRWVARFSASPSFVMAWIADDQYDHWQNAKDPLQYTAKGKSYAHLPMKSNGLPYPLEQMIIDTSENPGRWSFRNGYIEAIGAVMWLSDSFWKLTGARQEQVDNTAWLKVSHPSPFVTRIQAENQCFTTSEGTSGELQNRMRSLLYPHQL